MTAELEKKVNEHEHRISSQEQSTSEVIQALKDLTSAMNNQATQFAVYASKHDTSAAEMAAMKTKLDSHSETIAAMRPVVDGVRGLVWKVVGGALIGGTGVAAVIVAVFGKVG